MTPDTRPPAVAGLFYPAAAGPLREEIQERLAHAGPQQLAQRPKGLLVPHAGHLYSGDAAATAFAQLSPWLTDIHRIILLGPAHRVAFDGMAIPSTRRFATPLGLVTIDRDACDQARTCRDVVTNDAPHAEEHALEVQLPFLQCLLETDWQLLPVVVGRCSPLSVAAMIEQLWGDDGTLFLISSDLSHFHDDATARHIDAATLRLIDTLSPSIEHQQACGATPLNGWLHAAGQHRLTPHRLAFCNSADVSGDRNRVVGYCAYAFHEESK